MPSTATSNSTPTSRIGCPPTSGMSQSTTASRPGPRIATGPRTIRGAYHRRSHGAGRAEPRSAAELPASASTRALTVCPGYNVGLPSRSYVRRSRVDSGANVGVVTRPGRSAARSATWIARLRVPVEEWPSTFETRRLAPVDVRLEPLDRPGSLEVEPGAALRADRLQSPHRPRHVDERIRFTNGVRDAPAALGGREVQPIGDRPTPVQARSPRHRSPRSPADPHQAADVAGVAVRVPARGRDDREGLAEVAVPVEERHRHQRVVRDDVDIPAVPLVAVALDDPMPRRAPIRFR